MKYQKECESCHHLEVAYTYNLNVGKVQALRRLVDRYESTRKPVELGNLGITNSQYTNFCHLQYFDLARHIPEGWIPTPTGVAFIQGETSVLVPQAVMNGQVLPAEHEAWQTHTGERHPVMVQDIDNTAYKKRPEYAAEKTQTHTLFS